jgi:hypothetical protein
MQTYQIEQRVARLLQCEQSADGAPSLFGLFGAYDSNGLEQLAQLKYTLVDFYSNS